MSAITSERAAALPMVCRDCGGQVKAGDFQEHLVEKHPERVHEEALRQAAHIQVLVASQSPRNRENGNAGTGLPANLPIRTGHDVVVDMESRGGVTFVARDLVYVGGVSLLSGPPKKGKSTLLAQLAISRVIGEPFLGRDVKPGPILLLTEEGEYPFVYRWSEVAKAAIKNGVEFDVVILGDAVSKLGSRPAWEDILAFAADWCKGQRAPLVIIDTLAQWAGIEDENDASQTTQAIAAADAMAHGANAAVILVHHTRKGGGAGGEAIRGSSAILATVGISIEMRTVSEDTDDRTLYTQGRVIFGEHLRVGFDRQTLAYSLADSDDALAEIEAWLTACPATGEGTDEASLTNLWQITRRQARTRINVLIEKGRMRRAEGKTSAGTKKWFYWGIPAVPSHRRRDEEEDA